MWAMANLAEQQDGRSSVDSIAPAFFSASLPALQLFNAQVGGAGGHRLCRDACFPPASAVCCPGLPWLGIGAPFFGSSGKRTVAWLAFASFLGSSG